MDRDIWKSVNEIFHAALEVPSSDRRAFVAVASGDDAVLRSEVNALLEADAQAGNYLEEPLIPPNLLSATGNQVVAGDILCERFRILRKVGEGGM